MSVQAARRVPVAKALKILSPVAAALFFLTVILTLHMNTRMRQVLMTGANCICSCTDAGTNIKDSTSACGSNCKTTNSSLHQHPHGNIKLPSVCVNESCRSDYVKLLQRKDVHPIPEIRHILWRNESVSEYFAEQLSTWQKIHPNWTFVLWRDEDMDPFVATYFPGMLAKFRSLPDHIMRVDMIRYMLLYKYGGTYADLDYRLVGSLDRFRRFHAVVTQEPEAHSLQVLGLSWPVRPLASPAFLMSAPGHTFLLFVLQQLHSMSFAPHGTFYFAGPFGLSEILERYRKLFPFAHHPMGAVFVPPSFSFHPYEKNLLNSSHSSYLWSRRHYITAHCQLLTSNNDTAHQQLRRQSRLVQYCTDINNMDPITDKSQPVVAVHDLKKTGAIYDGAGSKFYVEKLRDMRGVMKHLKFGRDLMAD